MLRGALVFLAASSITTAQVTQSAAPRVIDDFENGSLSWTTHPSDGTRMTVTSVEGRTAGSHAMRIDFAFQGGGYAIVRKAIPLDFPENYELSFWIRGESQAQHLELKLVDSTGENVWWRNQRDLEFPRAWKRVSIKKRQISFAWGPLGGGELHRAAALEISVTASSGGQGRVWIDDIVLSPRAPVASSFAAPVMTTSASAVMLDLGAPREIGGAVVEWSAAAFSRNYDVQTSLDGSAWETVYAVRDGDGGRDYLYLPETETRFLRLALPEDRARHSALSAPVVFRVQPIAWSETRNAFFTNVARDATRGDFPKYLDGTQSYWTIVGVNGDEREALMNEQGMIEVDKSAFSLEPSLFVDGMYVSWADVTTSVSLADRSLPIPSVRWRRRNVRLDITAFASGQPGASVLWARYRVVNEADRARRIRLFVAVRPFQVNPPAQFLNTPGGSAIVRSIASNGRVVTVVGDTKVGTKVVVPVTRPSAFGAATFDAGGLAGHLHRGEVPARQAVADSLGAASAAFAYDLTMRAHDSSDVWVAVPFYANALRPAANLAASAAGELGRARLVAVTEEWRRLTNRVTVLLPPMAARISETLKANLAYMLITRDGASLEPGARSYERSWIRDGAMMASALLRLGNAEEARRYIEWYAPYQYANGKVPCCVDARGADPVPENDSHGELIFAIAEYYRYANDTAFLRRMWPHVQKAVSYIDSLRQSRMTSEYRTAGRRAFYGLVPQSISHEGYSAKPMHSYWDDAFTLRGLKDAADIASTLQRSERTEFARIRDEFRRDLMASYRLAMRNHAIDFLPGSVELGDFDATSTTVSVTPGGEFDSLPHPALEQTFEKYYQNFQRRRASADWNDYTPYELRVVGTMVRLGWKTRAHELLDFFFEHQRPAAWRAWAEVVHRDSTAAKFIGDLPHTWVGSDYIRSVLDMLAYERESDSALVLAAGVPAAWVQEQPGVVVKGLRTYHGILDYSMLASGNTVRTSISAVHVPPGGFVVHSPFDRPIRRALVNGATIPISSDGQSVVVRAHRATVIFEY